MKKLLDKIGTFLRNLFIDIFEMIELKAPMAVKITQDLKTAIEEHEGSIEWVLDKTKSEKDNDAYDFVKDKLPELIKELALIDGLVHEETSVEDAVMIYTNYLISKRKDGRAKEYIFLAAQILGMIIGKKAPIDLLVMVTQKAYRLIFKK